ncbi:MAG: hypothetical protein J5656_01245 [Clostridia bacterium]|nr:hypothetical protein [Clostridia bacterium]
MRKHFLIIVLVLMLALLLGTLVACSNKGTVSTTKLPDSDTGKVTPTPNPNPNPNPQPSGGDSGGSTTPDNPPSGGGDTNPDTPQPTPTPVVYTTVQRGQAFNNGATINLPTNTKAIGISSNLSDGNATSSADGDEDILNQYLVAFDEYNRVLTGNDGRITFTVRHKFYYEHETELVDGSDVDDEGNPIQIEVYVIDGEGNYVYKLDEHDEKIPLLDENGNVVFADDCTDEKEILGEDNFEILQEDFGMDVLKVKIVRNFMFVCFIVKLPADFDYSNNNATYNMLLEDGTAYVFTRSDLPKIRSDFSEDYDYDAHFYTSDLFTQSYVINLETSKIYPLNGISIDTIFEDGYVKLNDNKAYDVRCLADDSNLSLIDISGIINDPHTISVFKDKAGILYVMADNVSTMTAALKQNGTLPYVSYPDYHRENKYYLPYIIQDKKGNVYTFINHKLKKIIGFDFDNNALEYSEENYGESTIIVFDDEFMKGVHYNYLICGNYSDAGYQLVDMSLYSAGEKLELIDGFYPSYCYEKHFGFYMDKSIFFPFIFVLDMKEFLNFGLYIAIPDMYLSSISVSTILGLPDGFGMDVSYYRIPLVFNNSPLDLTGIQDITYIYHEEDQYLEIKLFMGKDDSFNDIYYYTTVDLMMTEFPESIEFTLNRTTPTRGYSVGENIITIQPIN